MTGIRIILFFVMFQALVGCQSQHGAPESLQPIDIKIPKPAYKGGPTELFVPRETLERFALSRPPFLAPSGCRNLAASCPVSSSWAEPIVGELSQITDGVKEAEEGTWVELAAGRQWVQIDLGRMSRIYAIVVWHLHAQPRIYKGVVVQVSNDVAFNAGVQTVFNNDRDNTLGLGGGRDLLYWETCLGKLIDCKGINGRYIRLWSNGNYYNDGNHYIEVEVWGIPSEKR